jgi:hypothetical protein
VSASTEEMSAQAEEVMAAATSLAELAGTLEALVAQFRLDTPAESRRHPGKAAHQDAAPRPPAVIGLPGWSEAGRKAS